MIFCCGIISNIINNLKNNEISENTADVQIQQNREETGNEAELEENVDTKDEIQSKYTWGLEIPKIDLYARNTRRYR